MSQTYQTRRRAGTAPAAKEIQTGAAGPSIQELAAGAAPTSEQMGSRVDLPGEIREKMESSFGADFSNVRLYESQTVADAGAEAVTQGNNIAFAPGKLDLTSTAGQALLGHELSHVVSQSRGESAGQGFLNDAHLEAQADRQGALAAQGQSVYQGPVSPIGGSSAVSAAGPMQAKKPPRTKDGTDVSEFAGEGALSISEPEIDSAKTDELNGQVKDPITSQYIEGTKSLASGSNIRQGYQTSYSDINRRRLYGDNEPTEAAMDDMWHNIYLRQGCIKYSDEYNRANANNDDSPAPDPRNVAANRAHAMSHTARDGHRALNGMSYENFKLGLANARKRRGL